MDHALDQALSTLERWGDQLLAMLPNIAVALVVLALFGLLGSLARRLVGRVLSRTKLSATTIPTLAKTASLAVVLLGVIVALNVLKLEEAAASMLAGAGVVGLALGFAFQDVAANYLAGFFLSVRHPFDVGDILETNGVIGVVESVELRNTRLRTFTGQLVSIPNRKVFQDVTTNYTAFGRRRIDVEVGVSYADDLEEVERVTREALESVEDRREEDPVEVYFTGFGGSSIDLVARFWIDLRRQPDVFRARHRAVMAIKRAYDAASITIPFPIRTLDFGIEGGATLQEMLPPPRARSNGQGDARDRAERPEVH